MKIKIKNVRLSFSQNLFNPGVYAADGDTGSKVPTFSAKFLFPKGEEAHKAISNAIKAAAKEKWLEKSEVVLKGLVAEGRTPLKDGDLKPEWDGFEGSMYINARDKKLPRIIDKHPVKDANGNLVGKVLTEADGTIYAGCFVDAIVDIYALDHKQFGKRICCGLKGVQFQADGDAFGGSAPVRDDEFDLSDTGEAAEADLL